MRLALELCGVYSRFNRPIVLHGPVGSGKTTLARSIHQQARPSKPFVSISAGELVETLYADTLFGHASGAYTGASAARDGALREAAAGTLLLDDLALMPVVAQAAILRVMESSRFRPLGARRDEMASCRWVFATTEDPLELVAEGRLLQDLASRLGEFKVRVPALRERSEDVLSLAAHFGGAFLAEHVIEARFVMADEVQRLLVDYSWPGNVRELRAVVERAAAHAGVNQDEVVVRPPHLPERIRSFDPEVDRRVRLNAELVHRVLDEVQGNRSEAARRLGVHRNTIGRYLKSS